MKPDNDYPKKRDECHHLDYDREKIGYMYSGDRICNQCGMIFINMVELKEAQEEAVQRLGPPVQEEP